MRVLHRVAAVAAAVILLSVPAMALVLQSPDMAEPQADEVAAVAAAVINPAAAPSLAANTGVPSTSVVTLTEWKYTSTGSPCGPKGDMNHDGVVNGLDVFLFTKVVIYGSSSLEQLCLADINNDGFVNGLDVDPFVSLVVNGSP